MECIYYEAPQGTLRLTAEDGQLTSCLWTADKGPTVSSSSVLKETCRWLDCYFSRKPLPSLPPLDHGKATPFTIKVRKALAEIPFGATLSYSAIAEKTGHPHACRAVGSACARNPFHVIIPCHRILPANGKIGNYAAGQEIKSRLLEFESEENDFLSA